MDVVDGKQYKLPGVLGVRALEKDRFGARTALQPRSATDRQLRK
jgi:hypothetical protein